MKELGIVNERKETLDVYLEKENGAIVLRINGKGIARVQRDADGSLILNTAFGAVDRMDTYEYIFKIDEEYLDE